MKYLNFFKYFEISKFISEWKKEANDKWEIFKNWKKFVNKKIKKKDQV